LDPRAATFKIFRPNELVTTAFIDPATLVGEDVLTCLDANRGDRVVFVDVRTIADTLIDFLVALTG
jgi:hypothetical protein